MTPAPVTDIRDAPAYSVGTAARCLGLPSATLRYWVVGRGPGSRSDPVAPEPLIQLPQGRGSLLSFNNLVEAHVLRALRTREGIKMSALRTAILYAENELGIERLLLSDELRSSGQDVFLDRLTQLINLSRSGQLAMKRVLESYLRRVDRDERKMPVRLYPSRDGRWSDNRRPIVIDPRVSFGRPVLVGSGVSTEAVARRIDAGESPEALAEDYGIAVDQVTDAITYEHAA